LFEEVVDWDYTSSFIESMLKSTGLKRQEGVAMQRWLTAATAVLVLFGCASVEEKELMRHYQKEKRYHKALLKTEAVTFKNQDGTAALSVTATYLEKPSDTSKGSLSPEEENAIASFFGLFKPKDVQKEKKIPERFIIGLHSEEYDTDGLVSGEVAFELNGKKPLRITPISPHDKRLKTLSFITDWGTYYLVVFPHASERMHLDVTFNGETKKMYFTKRAKFVYTKRAFD
jgi:hypothetical protein